MKGQGGGVAGARTAPAAAFAVRFRPIPGAREAHGIGHVATTSGTPADHLRNHGFLYDRGLGWRLSPAFDLNPTPTDERARVLATNIDEHDGTASLDLALETAGYYGIGAREAGRIAGEVGGWSGDGGRWRHA